MNKSTVLQNLNVLCLVCPLSYTVQGLSCPGFVVSRVCPVQGLSVQGLSVHGLSVYRLKSRSNINESGYGNVPGTVL
jgi:hypothetical protein